MGIFDNIDKKDIEKLNKLLCAKRLFFKKGSIILSNINNINTLGVIAFGSASLIRVDYDGSRSVIETLEKGDIFESKMFSSFNNELSIISNDDTEVILFDYDLIFSSYSKSYYYHIQFINNLLLILVNKLNSNYERIQILTKKTIRDKLLEYFKVVSFKRNSKTFTLPMNYGQLALYLSVNRSALMRELKNLKEEKIIKIHNKKITLIIY